MLKTLITMIFSTVNLTPAVFNNFTQITRKTGILLLKTC